MADYYKRPPIFQPMPSIAQMGQQNGGANYFGEPGMPPIAQGPSLDEQNAELLGRSVEDFMPRIPNTAPYVAPNYNSGSYKLPTDAQIGTNQNYSDPTDKKSTAYALTQGIHSLATGAMSAKQNKKFQRGEDAQSLVRNFLAPLAATFGPNGAAQGVNEYMKTSNENAVKRKEMNLKEQADAITQMKTMADMLKDNNPYTKDQLEMIVKRAAEEQKIRSEQALQAQREQAGKTDALQGAAHQAKALESTANIFKRRADIDLVEDKRHTEQAKPAAIEAQAANSNAGAELKRETTKQVVPKKAEALGAAAKASTARAGLADKQAAQVDPIAKAKEKLMQAQTGLIEIRKKAQEQYTGPADERAVNQAMSKLPPGEAGRFQAAIAIAKKHNNGQLTMADLITAQNASMGAHEKMLLREKANRAQAVGRPQPHGIPELKF